MKSTKDKILYNSRRLFNEQSYSSVTIRMIAKSLKMSSGNLNYHFKKREEILEALYFEMTEEFDYRLLSFPAMEVSINQIKIEIKLTMKRMIDYQFFWTDLYNILNLNANIKTHFHEIYDARFQSYIFLFTQLKKNKLMKVSILDWECQNLAEQMIVYSNTWLYSTVLYGGKIQDSIIEKKANTLLSLLYPYLTLKGKKEFYEITNFNES
ncbi:TetR/AcrR family transcriptional regulator [Psychroserpens damuponensis]|uniref:TetR/AcrR family transcriptional regulator n=1 Tax=Psychroserpens damuponensis TaxID=943936 RepID=UPI0005908B2D|nr:TetR/AcrR family transcriptional regulator [Psychroserpens damuponensis]